MATFFSDGFSIFNRELIPHVSLAAVLCVCILLRKRLGSIVVNALSFCINQYLLVRYPIRREETGEPIPSCPYQWPNGQGDIGKFLQGIENSDAWEKEFGRVYRIWSGMKPEIVLTRPEHLKSVFKDSNKHMKAIDNNSGYLMSQVLGKCVGLVSGSEWQTLRKVTEVPFQHKTVGTYVGDIREHVKSYLRDLENAGNILSRGILHPALDMKMLPFFAVAEVFYGKLSSDMIKELRQLAPLREELFHQVIKGGLSRFHFSRALPTKSNRLLSTFKEKWAVFNTSAYERAVKDGSNAPIISMFNAAKSSQISMDQLLQTLDESLYANLDVTTGGLSWNLVYLAANPSVQSELRQEIASHEQDLDSYVQKSTSLLAACILESSRITPLAAFSVPQSAPTDRVVDGYRIPAGTDFVVDSYALNVRHDFWGPDTKTYRPQRWLELNQFDLRYHFWRFGFGPRQCMGKYVADAILRSLLVELLGSYHLELVDKEQPWERDPDSWITHPNIMLRCRKII